MTAMSRAPVKVTDFMPLKVMATTPAIPSTCPKTRRAVTRSLS
ncbi:MAG: hypothetical protein R6V19_16115 [Armatimonadota bacterium]